MIRKTALLTGVAGALMFAAPAFAQDMTQDPATDPMAQPPAAEAEALPEPTPETMTPVEEPEAKS